MELQYFNLPMRDVFREFCGRMASVENSPDIHSVGARMVEMIEGRVDRADFEQEFLDPYPDPGVKKWLSDAYLLLTQPTCHGLDYIASLIEGERPLFFDSWNEQGDMVVVCNPNL